MTDDAKVNKNLETVDTYAGNISGNMYATIDFNSVQSLCNKAKDNKLMIGLIADTGQGKTTSLKAYKAANSNVCMVTVDKTMNAKRLYLKILSELGVQFDGNIHDVMLKIAQELNRLDNPVLIVDEAGKMNHVMMLYMHDLREYTRANCAIVLAGMPYFKKNLVRFSEKQKEGCSEFLRRINLWHTLQGLSRDEIKYICQMENITDMDRIKELCHYHSFGDLMNEILLEKVIKEEI